MTHGSAGAEGTPRPTFLPSNPRLISLSSDEHFPFQHQPNPVSKKTSATAEKKEDVSVPSAGHLNAPVNARLSKDQKVDLYRLMVRIRRFEERSLRAYQAKKIG